MRIELLGSEELKRILEEIPSTLYPLIKAEFQKTIFSIQKEMQQRTAGGALKKRTGELSRSFTTQIAGSNIDTLFGSVETNSPYAQIHEFGGIIRAKRAKYLTIPLDAMKTAAGVTRMSASQAISQGRTFFATSKSGNLILFRNEGGGQITPLFILKESVSIPARLGFFETAKKEFTKMISTLEKLIQRG